MLRSSGIVARTLGWCAMSDELKPCPCCGSASLETTENINESNNLGRCGAVWCECGLHMSARTLKEAMTAWNARAAVTDEQFASAVNDGEAWQKVRTCHMKPAVGGGWYCSECHIWVAPNAMANATEHMAPRYCPNCGAKVVG